MDRGHSSDHPWTVTDEGGGFVKVRGDRFVVDRTNNGGCAMAERGAAWIKDRRWGRRTETILQSLGV